MKMNDFEEPMSTSSVTMEVMETDNYGVEAELTSLSWLQSLDITSASSLPTPPCSPSPPPVPRQPAKKMSPLLKAELGKLFFVPLISDLLFTVYYLLLSTIYYPLSIFITH